MKPGAQLCSSNSDSINLVLVVDAKLGEVQEDGNSTDWMAPETVPVLGVGWGVHNFSSFQPQQKLGMVLKGKMEKKKKAEKKNNPKEH